MSGLIEYHIPIASLKQGRYEYIFSINDHFFKHFEGSLIQKAQLITKMELEKRSSLIELSFHTTGEIGTICDRCLEPMSIEMDERQHLVVKYSDQLEDDMEVAYIPLGTEVLDVSPYIYELLHLLMPIVNTHEAIGEDCPVDLEAFLEDDEDVATDDAVSSVWDVLKNINIDSK